MISYFTELYKNNIKKSHISKIAVLMFSCIISSLSFAAGTPVGKWQTIDDKSGKPKSIIEISLVDSALEGKILELLGPQASAPVCKKCKDERAGQPLIGMVILWDVTEASNKKSWGGGEILDPKTGKVYSVKLTVKKDGEALKVRGFFGTPLLGRTQVWKRINE